VRSWSESLGALRLVKEVKYGCIDSKRRGQN